MPPQRFALPSEVPGLAARRIAADILDGVLHKHRTLDEQLDGAAAHPGAEDAVRSRPRADAPAGGDDLAAARHARPRAVAAARSRHPDRCAARAKRAPDRRRANPLDGRARSCRGRSVGAAGAVGPARREICRARQCGAAPLRARGPAADRRGQVADARCSAMATGALDRPLRRDRRARDRDRDRPRAVARYHREIRCCAVGDAPAWRNAADGVRAHAAAGFGDDAAGFHRGPMVGAGCRRRVAGAAVRRRRRQNHRRSLRRAGRQDRATRAGRRARHRDRPFAGRMARLRDNLARLALEAETVVADAVEWPGGERQASTACWSMRPAPRPAPSAAIPMSPGCGRRPISPRWWRCRSDCCKRRSRC